MPRIPGSRAGSRARRPNAGPNAGRDALAAAAEALQRAGRATSPYALVTADPLAALAESWREMWDVSKVAGSGRFELEAAKALAGWRAGRFELPDYYLVLASARPRTPGRISTSGRCARPGRTGWCPCPMRSPPSRPRGCCTPSAHCGTAPGGPAWTR